MAARSEAAAAGRGPQQRRATVIDVAARAEVSSATVSRVLNGYPVARATRERVDAGS